MSHPYGEVKLCPRCADGILEVTGVVVNIGTTVHDSKCEFWAHQELKKALDEARALALTMMKL